MTTILCPTANVFCVFLLLAVDKDIVATTKQANHHNGDDNQNNMLYSYMLNKQQL